MKGADCKYIYFYNLLLFDIIITLIHSKAASWLVQHDPLLLYIEFMSNASSKSLI